jgi:acyl-CoA thioesterase YciA
MYREAGTLAVCPAPGAFRQPKALHKCRVVCSRHAGIAYITCMAEPYLALQVLMMPKDTNGYSLPGGDGSGPRLTIFGGVILSYIDQAGAIGARREIVRAGGPPPFLVTVAMNRVEFHQPVFVGDVVRFLTDLVRIGRTSATMHVNVEVERSPHVVRVTEAEVVYVAIDPLSPQRRSIPLLSHAGETGQAG